MKLFIITCLLASIISGAQANDLYSDNRTIEEVRQANWLHKHSGGHQLLLADTSILPIDGMGDSITISQERTSLPVDYMDMPTSKRDMERYKYGR